MFELKMQEESESKIMWPKTIIDACSMLIFKQISYIFRLKSKFGGKWHAHKIKWYNEKTHTQSDADADTVSMMHSVSYLCVSNVFEIYTYILFSPDFGQIAAVHIDRGSFQQSLKFNVI